MKKIIMAVLLAAALAGCSGYDHLGCRNSVVKDVGTQDVVEVSSWHFVAKDTQGNIWYYETMNVSNTKITSKTPLFKSN
jgi:ABC-type glycerol-3-phosphate transport system substrate-binding protein